MVTTVEVLLTPRWFRWLDAALTMLWWTGVATLAVRLLRPAATEQMVALSFGDAALLLGPVVAGALVRKLVLWPHAARAVAPEPATVGVGFWPGSVGRLAEGDVCAASWEALEALRLGPSWWSRYRALVVHHGLRGGVRRALAFLAVMVGLTIPIFLLQQAIEYGAPRGQWVADGFGAWARSLVKSGLAVGVSGAVWWGLLSVALQVTWALLALRRRSAERAARWVWWGAWSAWAAGPLALLLRQVA